MQSELVHRVLLAVSLRYKLKWLGKLNSCKLCTVECIVLANIITIIMNCCVPLIGRQNLCIV